MSGAVAKIARPCLACKCTEDRACVLPDGRRCAWSPTFRGLCTRCVQGASLPTLVGMLWGKPAAHSAAAEMKRQLAGGKSLVAAMLQGRDVYEILEAEGVRS